jgi:hypothetical protein
MELINPTLTIENTDSNVHLVRLEHRVSELEHIDVRLRITRTAESLRDVQVQTLRTARSLMGQMLETLGEDTSGS